MAEEEFVREAPENLNTLPAEMQAAYKSAFNEYMKELRGQEPRTHDNATTEEMARRAAWIAITKEFRKNPNSGQWEKII